MLDVLNDEYTPILLKKAEKKPDLRDFEITANMTVVTTPGNNPEMHDQKDDPTAPRRD